MHAEMPRNQSHGEILQSDPGKYYQDTRENTISHSVKTLFEALPGDQARTACGEEGLANASNMNHLALN